MTIATVRIQRYNTPISRPVLDFSKFAGADFFNIRDNALLSSMAGNAIGSLLSGDSSAIDGILGNLKEQGKDYLTSFVGDQLSGLTAALPNINIGGSNLQSVVRYMASGDRQGLQNLGLSLIQGIIPIPYDCSAGSSHGSVVGAIAGGSSRSDQLASTAAVGGAAASAFACGASGFFGGLFGALGNNPFLNGLMDGLLGSLGSQGNLNGVHEVSGFGLGYTNNGAAVGQNLIDRFGNYPGGSLKPKVDLYSKFTQTLDRVNPSWRLRGNVLSVASLRTSSDDVSLLVRSGSVGRVNTSQGANLSEAQFRYAALD